MKIQNQLKWVHSASVGVSFLINGVLVVLLLFFLQLEGPQPQKVGAVKIIEAEEKIQIVDLVDEPLPPLDPKEVDERDWENPEIELEVTVMELDPEPVQPLTEASVNLLEHLLFPVSEQVVIANLPPRTDGERKKRLEDLAPDTGGISEEAVRKALLWLRDHQKADGSWDKAGTVGPGGGNTGYTGLAVLCFLAHGELPSSRDFGATVSRALRYLVENQDSRGLFQPAGSHTAYGHAMATYAIAEGYAMTGNLLLQEPLERAVRVIVEGMQPEGGFDYEYRRGDRNDSSVGAWQLQALHAALLAGVEVPGLEANLQKAMDGLLHNASVSEDRLSFGYTSPGTRRIISAAGSLCLQLSQRGGTREGRMAFNHLRRHADRQELPAWNAALSQGDHGGEINFWYYAAQAFYHQNPRGDAFRAFYPAMVRALVQGQGGSGEWLGFEDKAKSQGPVYNTTLASLALMTTYRHLSSSQVDSLRPVPVAPSNPPAEQAPVDFSL